MPNTEPVRVTIFNQTYSLVASEEPGRIEHLAQKVDDLMSSIAVRAGNIDATRAAVLLACTWPTNWNRWSAVWRI